MCEDDAPVSDVEENLDCTVFDKVANMYTSLICRSQDSSGVNMVWILIYVKTFEFVMC
jgi:hypothetical protein